MIEELILTIAESSGHTVTGQQDRMRINDLAGHRDAVIDGMTIDVKSASPPSRSLLRVTYERTILLVTSVS